MSFHVCHLENGIGHWTACLLGMLPLAPQILDEFGQPLGIPVPDAELEFASIMLWPTRNNHAINSNPRMCFYFLHGEITPKITKKCCFKQSSLMDCYDSPHTCRNLAHPSKAWHNKHSTTPLIKSETSSSNVTTDYYTPRAAMKDSSGPAACNTESCLGSTSLDFHEYLRQKPQGCLLNSKDFIGELSLLKVHVNGHQGFMPICENWVPKHHHLLFL